MKKFFTLFSGLLLAAVIGLAQGKWEQSSVIPYGTGGINRSGERIDNSYSAGKFNSEVKSTSKNNPYVYFRKAQFSVPGKTFRPGDTFTVNMNLTVKRHSGNGTPKGNAGAVIVNGKAGQGASVPSQISVSGKDAAKSGSATLSIPSHSAAGNNFSIVYSCFDIKVVYLYQWVEDKPVATEQPARTEERVVVADEPALPQKNPGTDELVMPDDTILPPADSVAAMDYDFAEADSSAFLVDNDTVFPEEENLPQEETLFPEKVKATPKDADEEIFLSLFGMNFTKKDTIMYGIICGLGLLVLVLLLVLLFRKNPAKKAAKEEAKKAAAEAKASAKAEAAEKAAAAKAAAAEKAAAMKAEQEAKLAEQKAAAAEKAAAAKAAQEAAKAEAAEKAAAAKAEREAKLAEQKEKAAAMKAEREAKLAEQKAAQAAKQEELKAAREAKLAEQKAAQEAKMAELKAKKEAAAAAAAAKAAEQKAKATEAPKPEPKPEEKPAEAPAAQRFCENCGAPLAPDAAFCENCGTKVN